MQAEDSLPQSIAAWMKLNATMANPVDSFFL
jgi:hypothetical protein